MDLWYFVLKTKISAQEVWEPGDEIPQFFWQKQKERKDHLQPPIVSFGGWEAGGHGPMHYMLFFPYVLAIRSLVRSKI